MTSTNYTPYSMYSNRWVFTLHKPKRTDRPHTWPDVVTCVYQLETNNGSFHYQGYVEFSKPKSLKQMKSFHGGMWCKPAFGTAEQNFKYCTKESTRADPDAYFAQLE